MTKQEIVDAVSEATGLTKVETETVMNGIMTTITESLARNERELNCVVLVLLVQSIVCQRKQETPGQVKLYFYLNDMFQHLNLRNTYEVV